MLDRPDLPRGLTDPEHAWPVFHIPADDAPGDAAADRTDIHDAVVDAVLRALPEGASGQGLVKVHIGEPKCETRMRPAPTRPSADALLRAGASGVVAGDTTVAYTGRRGHKQNPPEDASAYTTLAEEHGWSVDGDFGAPFVVLDRPATSVDGVFVFEEESRRLDRPWLERFNDVYAAGGFLAADVIANNAHLTLHGLAGVAGCVKSVAMGFASHTGKLRMHQSLLPAFDAARCVGCGRCVSNCPEDALVLEDDESIPEVDPDACIGCGECEAVCVKRAVVLEGNEIDDWTRGQHTLPIRMTDYAVGLMDGYWERTVHVLQMYTITERCDCIDMRQKPMLPDSLGFLIGRNPFAVDRLAGEMLREALAAADVETDPGLLDTARQAAEYASERYGVLPEAPVERIVPSG